MPSTPSSWALGGDVMTVCLNPILIPLNRPFSNPIYIGLFYTCYFPRGMHGLSYHRHPFLHFEFLTLVHSSDKKSDINNTSCIHHYTHCDDGAKVQRRAAHRGCGLHPPREEGEAGPGRGGQVGRRVSSVSARERSSRKHVEGSRLCGRVNCTARIHKTEQYSPELSADTQRLPHRLLEAQKAAYRRTPRARQGA